MKLREDVRNVDIVARENVENRLQDTKVFKQSTSSRNQNELTSFINKLPYLENTTTDTQVEDFITKPINTKLVVGTADFDTFIKVTTNSDFIEQLVEIFQKVYNESDLQDKTRLSEFINLDLLEELKGGF